MVEVTEEQAKKLEKLGIATITYSVKCDLCKEKVTGKTDEECKKNLSNHLRGRECKVMEYLRHFKKGTKMKEIGEYVELIDKITMGKGKPTKEDLDRFWELTKEIVIDETKWGKKL